MVTSCLPSQRNFFSASRTGKVQAAQAEMLAQADN